MWQSYRKFGGIIDIDMHASKHGLLFIIIIIAIKAHRQIAIKCAEE